MSSLEDFENISARFIAEAVRSAPEDLVPSILASPLCSRSPDICMLWHPGFREKYKIPLFFKNIFSIIPSALKGLMKLFYNLKPYGYALYGKLNGSLLVIPSNCGYESSSGEYKTNYVSSDTDDALFVFGLTGTCGKGEIPVKEVALKDKFLFTLALVKSGFYAYFKNGGDFFDSSLLLLNWLSWSLSLNWLSDLYLKNNLSEIIENYSVKKIGCIHEMHSYARLVWKVAAKFKCKKYTIQHAAFSRGKRWYFYCPEEKDSGLELPDIMFVYNKRVADVLKLSYNNTYFPLGCSNRYAHWKNVGTASGKGEYYLFAGALAEFDNNVLFTCLSSLLDTSNERIPVRLRLHPHAKLSVGFKRWINSAIKKGIVCLSKNTSLKTDLEKAIAVIGMSTTVLEESLLLGRPVIQIQHNDYLEYIDLDGVEGVVKKNYKDIRCRDLLNMSELNVNCGEMKARLGLELPVITYKRLFAQ